jgi:TrmH family RNA methyltransferase
MVLMMGSERQGLQRQLMESCDQIVSMPMAGKSDSLNLAVATGVMLYEIYSQHRKASKK